MVVYSNINAAVFYKETKALDPEDEGYSSTLYELEVYGKTVVIAFGKVKHTFSERNIVFYPIYLINNKRQMVGQIGIMEIPKRSAIEILDEDGDIDVAKLPATIQPILYEYADTDLIDKSGSNAVEFLRMEEKADLEKTVEGKTTSVEKEQEEEQEEADEEDDLDEVAKVRIPEGKKSPAAETAKEKLKDGIFTVDPSIRPPETLVEETEEDVAQARKEFKESPKNLWIETFMKNNAYDIHDVEANGDCLFAVIREAYKQIGQITTVAKLRAIVAQHATEKMFAENRALYTSLKGQIEAHTTEMAKIKRTLEEDMKRRAEYAEKKGQQQEVTVILEETRKMKAKYEELREEKATTEAIIREAVGFFATVHTLEEYRAFIQTSNYWADSWTISVLETALQMKMVILSERSFREGNMDGVLQCGELDEGVEKAKMFVPKFYIMTAHSGAHYKLVTYKEKRIFTYPELPYKIKALVINKCMERNSGPFSYIPEFKLLKARMGLPAEDDEEKEKEGHGDRDLYDKDVVFQFGIAQPVVAKPGTASGEKISTEKRSFYTKLAKYKEWRRKLDDEWTEATFSLDGHQWASVEHYIQACKFKEQFPDFYVQFSKDAGSSEIAKDVDLAKVAGGKTGRVKAKGPLLRPENVVPNPKYEGEMRQNARINAVRSKFTQNEEMQHLLTATLDAKLVRFVRRGEAETDEVLMHIRKELTK
jgi:predicted NAD-dependent protein-ADP-ribosyltransferase YbiA (DUF1768 family)